MQNFVFLFQNTFKPSLAPPTGNRKKKLRSFNQEEVKKKKKIDR